jgi:sulfite exporter TauE/SafE
MLVMPFQHLPGLRKIFGILLYHFGRITTYAVLGLILYSFRSVFDPHIQQYVSVGVGVLLLAAGLLSFIGHTASRFSLPWTGQVKQALSMTIGKPGLPALFFTGSLNGLLPCGLVYMALSASLSGSTAMESALLMYAFGLGTVPMLVAITLVRNRVSLFHAGRIRKLVPVILFLFGCIFVLRGANLGIPILSPHVAVEQCEIKATCCHKN